MVDKQWDIALIGLSEENHIILFSALNILSRERGEHWIVSDRVSAQVAIADIDTCDGLRLVAPLRSKNTLIIPVSEYFGPYRTGELCLAKPLRSSGVLKCLHFVSSQLALQHTGIKAQ